jgi:hypothetical protein
MRVSNPMTVAVVALAAVTLHDTIRADRVPELPKPAGAQFWKQYLLTPSN